MACENMVMAAAQYSVIKDYVTTLFSAIAQTC